ncbi:MAG: alpha-amylase family glycosyl hydrolase [Bacteroidota bacterium]
MYQYQLHQQISLLILEHKIDVAGKDNLFYSRFLANSSEIAELYFSLYGRHPKATEAFTALLQTITKAYAERCESLKLKDEEKEELGNWFLTNQLAGMSLYVDRFCGDLNTLSSKLDYFKKLGVNFLHLMPLFESPTGESDGGYAVSNFRKVDSRFGNLEDLQAVQQNMSNEGMYLMIDIVLNHTSFRHEWAEKAKQGDKKYQDYFYMFDDRGLPNWYEETMPEIFPEVAPGSFSYVPECNKWVMSVFHNYQWDLNYSNPDVFVMMLDTIFFYANLGVDVLRIDAPAFIWKKLGTSCQNLPEAHTLLRLIKQCVQVAAPGMALLGEAIVAPKEIMKYFGTDRFFAKECDFAYNATQMALQWDALATGDTRVMLAAQNEILQKPYGCSWITYTRCHDDIGLGYDDSMIAAAGFNAYEHRRFLKEYYSGALPNSPASGALFSVNPKTQDARISGSLASLCGLEKALRKNDLEAIETSIQKISMMQAQSFFIGGLPIIFYGDEMGYTNDYSYLKDPGKSYDNRWMHRPIIDWNREENIDHQETVESKVFHATKRMIEIRKSMMVFGDYKNLTWLTPYNIHVAGFIRSYDDQKVYCLFNYNNAASYITWYAFKNNGNKSNKLYDHWSGREYTIGSDHEYLILPPYSFCILEVID